MNIESPRITGDLAMTRVQYSLLIACVVMMSVGCRNRCNTPCSPGLFAGNSTLAPPPTYSLNIPSVANNQPYYTPGQAAPTNNTLNTNQRAPTPQQQGWRAANGNLSNTNTSSPQSGESRSVLTNQTKFVETTAPQNGNPLNPGNQPPARMAALPGSGVSFTNSQNFQSTPFDERRDATQMPVSDASGVRAPSRNYPTGNVPQFQSPANYSTPTQQTYAQNGIDQPQPGYSGQLMVYGGQPASYQGQALLVNPNAYPQNSQAVLAQSTASVGSSSASQVGWRSRELNSDRISR